MTVAELNPERQRARLTCTCKGGRRDRARRRGVGEGAIHGQVEAAAAAVVRAIGTKATKLMRTASDGLSIRIDAVYSAASVLALPLASRRPSTGARNCPV